MFIPSQTKGSEETKVGETDRCGRDQKQNPEATESKDLGNWIPQQVSKHSIKESQMDESGAQGLPHELSRGSWRWSPFPVLHESDTSPEQQKHPDSSGTP